jgi:hypothetical protein
MSQAASADHDGSRSESVRERDGCGQRLTQDRAKDRRRQHQYENRVIPDPDNKNLYISVPLQGPAGPNAKAR